MKISRSLRWLSLAALLPVLLLSVLPTRAQDAYAPPAGYYDNANGLTGTALRNALHDIIGGHKIVSYSNALVALQTIDESPGNSANVDLIYSAATSAKSGAGQAWNREHLWPQSRGIESSGADYSDLFNLRPCDNTVNSDRGNKYFDISSTSDSGYKMPADAKAGPDTSTDSNSWQPPVSERGDIARSLFYMDVRYDGNTSRDPSTTDLVLLNTIAQTPQMAKLSTLLAWNNDDPVDQSERRRNSLIYTQYQNNRNPFIDHPEWAASIFGGAPAPTPTPVTTPAPTATPGPTPTPAPTPNAAPLATLPLRQNWNNTALITANDDWSKVTGIVGYRGDGLTGGPNPRNVTGTSTVVDVNANQTDPATFSAGGVTEFELPNPTIALSGSSTALAPYIALRFSTQGFQNITVSYTLRDIDGSTDDAVQPVALQFRIGATGAWQNVADGSQTEGTVTTAGTFVADATSGPSLATKTTLVTGVLPAGADNQPEVQVRIITCNATGNDEAVGIDDIVADGTPPPAFAHNTVPGAQSVTQDTPLVFGTGSGNRIAVTDADAGDTPLRVTLGATGGTITLSRTTGLAFETGDGSDDAALSFLGTLTDLNAALDGLRFVPSPNTSGAASLRITAQQVGETSGDDDTVPISVTPVTYALQGSVTIVSSGAVKGLANVQVVAVRADGAKFIATTGSGGGYTVAGLTAGSYTLSCTTPGFAYSYAPAPAQAQPLALAGTAPARSGLNFTARPVMSGTVYNALAQLGLSGITVRAFKADSSDTTVVAEVVSDAQGRWALALEPGSYNLAAVRATDPLFRVRTTFPLPLVVPDTVATRPVLNFRSIGITGRIVTASNAPVAGVRVNLYNPKDTGRTRILRASTTDANGFFSLEGVAEGTWNIVPVSPTTNTYTPTSRLVPIADKAVFTTFQAAPSP